MNRSLRTLLAVATCATFAACGGGGDGSSVTNPPPPAPTPVASVTVTPSSVQLLPPAMAQLTATPKDANGNALSNRTVTWSTSASAVATVSTAGLVSALTPGSAVITATSEGQSGSATITVIPPVASVTLDPSAANLVPAQTKQLAATAKDAAGNTLTGRALVWSTSAGTIATVSTTGLVTGVALGNAAITATVEGKSASATITVGDGGVVGTVGGSVVAAGGAVKVDVPAGAAPDGTALTVVTVPQPAPAPDNTWLVGAAFYRLGPDGATFTTPVTVTLRYDPATLPPWVVPADLGIQRWDGTRWNTLANITVDAVAHTISGKTGGFSTFAPSLALPSIAVTPNPGQINYQQRSVALTANVSHPPAGSDFQYNWSTSGASGSVNTPFGNTTVNFEDVKTFTAEVRDAATGALYNNPGNMNYTWTYTSNAGSATPAAGVRTAGAATATYTAFKASQQVMNPVRGDKLSVTITERQDIIYIDGRGFKTVTPTYTDLGSADGFVQVGVNTYPGRFAVVTVPTGGGSCVYAYLCVPHVTPASQYDLYARDYPTTLIQPGMVLHTAVPGLARPVQVSPRWWTWGRSGAWGLMAAVPPLHPRSRSGRIAMPHASRGSRAR